MQQKENYKGGGGHPIRFFFYIIEYTIYSKGMELLVAVHSSFAEEI